MSEKAKLVVPRYQVDVSHPDALDALLAEQCNIQQQQIYALMVAAGKNRQLNGPAAITMAERITGTHGAAATVIARVDDEELWPDDLPELRRLSVADRLDRIRTVDRDAVMDAVPLLRELEQGMTPGTDAQLAVIVQPQCTSYAEMYWSLQPPAEDMALADGTSQLMYPANCPALQQRLALASRDALRTPPTPASLEQVTIVQHVTVNEEHERRAYQAAQILRTVLGRRGYMNLCTGQGKIGALYKYVQDWKIRRSAGSAGTRDE